MAILLAVTALALLLLGSTRLSVSNPRFDRDLPATEDVRLPAVVRYLSSLSGHQGTACYGLVLTARAGVPERVLNLTAIRPELGSSFFTFVEHQGFALADEMFETAPDLRPKEYAESVAESDLAERILPPVDVSLREIEAGERFILSTGFNYDEHREETHWKRQILVAKLVEPTGAYRPVSIGLEDGTDGGQGLLPDYEVEIGFVLLEDIDLNDLPGDEDLRHALAFFHANDLSDRWPMILEGDIGYTKGKSRPSYLPIGPWMVHGSRLNLKTRSGGSEELQLQLRVDEPGAFRGGAWRQQASSTAMILGPREILARVTELYEQSMRPDAAGTIRPIARRKNGKLLLPAGSIVLTGTPGGTAIQAPMGLDKARLAVMAGLSTARARLLYAKHCVEHREEMGFLKESDTVESRIQHLGHQRWKVQR